MEYSVPNKSNREFLISYSHKGKRYGGSIIALNRSDALAKCRSLGCTLDGEKA